MADNASDAAGFKVTTGDSVAAVKVGSTALDAIGLGKKVSKATASGEDSYTAKADVLQNGVGCTANASTIFKVAGTGVSATWGGADGTALALSELVNWQAEWSFRSAPPCNHRACRHHFDKAL